MGGVSPTPQPSDLSPRVVPSARRHWGPLHRGSPAAVAVVVAVMEEVGWLLPPPSSSLIWGGYSHPPILTAAPLGSSGAAIFSGGATRRRLQTSGSHGSRHPFSPFLHKQKKSKEEEKKEKRKKRKQKKNHQKITSPWLFKPPLLLLSLQEILTSTSVASEGYEFSKQCTFHHLKVVVIHGVIGCMNELKLLEFVLKNVVVLEEMVVWTVDGMPSDKKKGLMNFSKMLLRIPRASSTVAILLLQEL
ncbi:hypothetical protein Sjap_003592 [Stephania japonica]|uniref:FBD domain-containing protein n=1 Tax=Stephania japonica TaxID=461633 RepID=A0AAP0PTR0_9MAGN